MSIIWKINPKYIHKTKEQQISFFDYHDIDFSKTFFCIHCLKYVKDKKFKSLLIPVKDPYPVFYDNPTVCEKSNNIKKYNKCHICERIISGIINGPNIVNFLNNSLYKYSETEILLKLNKFTVWYYHDIYDDFTINLINNFSFTHEQMKNIHQTIKELYALPNRNIILERADDIYNLVVYNIRNSESHK